MRITKLEPDPRGFWTANVSDNGRTVRVDNSCGSWTSTAERRADPGARNVRRREVQSYVAAALQKRVSSAERREPIDENEEIEMPTMRERATAVMRKMRSKPTVSTPEPRPSTPMLDPKVVAARMARAGLAAAAEAKR